MGKTMHDPWTDRLSEYFDGDLAPAEAEALEAHLRECLACRNARAGIRELAQRTAALRDREPANDLWPAILGQIRAEVAADSLLSARAVAGASPPEAGSAPAPAVIPLAGRRSPTPRRFSFSLPQLLAAVLATVAISATAVWLALNAVRTAAPPDVTAATEGAPAGSLGGEGAVLVSSVDQAYGDAIDELEREFAARRDRLDPETVRVVEENLRVIDDAIDEARAALARDPANGFLYRHLDRTMTKKLDLLRRAAGAALVST